MPNTNRPPFTHRDALRVCRRTAGAKAKKLTELEALYLFVAAYAPQIRPQFVLLRRYHVPKPSGTARANILAAVAALVKASEEQDRGTLSGVSLLDISAALSGCYTYSTLRNYVSKLAESGDLIRVAEGVYRFPSTRA
jgi:hypothetical protein